MMQEAQLTPGYIEVRNGKPVSSRPMRLSELRRRADDPDDAQFGIASVARIAMVRHNAGLCEECGVLPSTGFCTPCLGYLFGNRMPLRITVTEIMEMAG